MVLDIQIQEHGNRFSEAPNSLIENMLGLNPCDSFSKFHKSKMVIFYDMYPNDIDLSREYGCCRGLRIILVETKRQPNQGQYI